MSQHLQRKRRRAIKYQSVKKGIRALSAILALCLMWPGISGADELFSRERLVGDETAPWNIRADTLSYDDREGRYEAHGNVEISKGERSIRADHATYDMETQTAELWGNVRFESGPDVLEGSRGQFNLKTRTGKLEDGDLFLTENHFYLRGGSMEKVGPASYALEDFRLTTCDGDKPDWTITGTRASVTIEGYGEVYNAAFRIRDIPVLYVPYMLFPAKTKRQTGLLPPRAGFSSLNGAELEIPFFWAISERVDATFYPRYMSERGYMQGLEFRYLAADDSEGVLLFDILRDMKDKDMSDDDDLELSPFSRTNSTRYWFRGKAEQELPSGVHARFDGDYVSDQDYLSEFETDLFGLQARPDLSEEFGRPVEEKKSPLRRSAMRISRDGGSHSLQALASYHQRPENPRDDRTSQPLGGLDYSILPFRLMDLPAFFMFDSDYDYVWREEGDKGHRLSLSPEMTFPIWIGSLMEFEPHMRYSYNFQWVDNEFRDSDHQHRQAYELGADLSTEIWKVFPVDWEDATRLRHGIRPVLGYNYRRHEGEWGYTPWFERIDGDGDENRILFSLENFLDARLENDKGDVSYRQWGTFKLEQGYSISEERRGGDGEEPFDPLYSELVVTSLPGIDFRAEAEYDHYDQEVISTDLSMEYSHKRSANRVDTFGLEFLYEPDENESLNLNANVHLVHGFYAGGNLEREFSPGHEVSSACWIGYNSQCWGIKLVGERGDNETSLMIGLNLLGLGELDL